MKRVLTFLALLLSCSAARADLAASYYRSIDFTGPAIGRIDPNINFDWSTRAPLPDIPVDNFSVRWTGEILALASEPHRFTAQADDKIRVYLDGKKIISRSNGSATLPLEAGRRYPITVEFIEFGKAASARLLWTSPSTPKQIIPASAFSLKGPSPLPVPTATPQAPTPQAPTPTPLPPVTIPAFDPTNGDLSGDLAKMLFAITAHIKTLEALPVSAEVQTEIDKWKGTLARLRGSTAYPDGVPTPLPTPQPTHTPQPTPTPTPASSTTTKVTKMVTAQLVGSPFAAKAAYARNVWDMQVFDGKVFIGHGNSSNFAPSSNAGPIPVVYLTPETDSFVSETTITEEQIDIFRTFNTGELYTPSHDPRGAGPAGFWTRGNDGVWTQTGSISGTSHVYDLMQHSSGKLLAALGSSSNNNTAAMSSNGGSTWSFVLQHPERTKWMFEFGGDIYAGIWITNTTSSSWGEAPYYSNPALNGIYKWNNTTNQFASANIDARLLIPGLDANFVGRMVRSTNYGSGLLFIAGITTNDHQWEPTAAFYTANLTTGTKIALPAGVLPYDIVVRGGTAYLLASKRNGLGDYENIVYSSTNGTSYTEVFRFAATSFARSFEEVNGDFYFGMGTDTTELSADTGKVYKVAAAAYAPASEPPVVNATRVSWLRF
jgi:hypothetical protein